MEEKVAQAIEKRGKAKVHDAAQKLRNAAEQFAKDFYGYSGYNPKDLAKALRALADEFEGKENAFIVPKVFWEQANQRAYDEFMTQFDHLTQYVNRNIEFKNGNCQMPDKEE